MLIYLVICDKKLGLLSEIARNRISVRSGEISREFNNHKTKKDWAYSWQKLTMDE